MIIKLLKLLYTFMKIALFNFGGGYVMISLIENEVVGPNGFGITPAEFANIIAVSEITPGPISINTATYVGYKIAGVLGSLVATLAIPIPSFFIVVFLSPILAKYKDHPLNKMIFYGLRAVVVGLIFNAAFILVKTPLFAYDDAKNLIFCNLQLLRDFDLPFNLNLINFGSIGIFIVSLILILKLKLNPILVILISGLLGIIIFSI